MPSFGQGRGRVGRTPRARTLGTHTKSSAYKMWRRACRAAGVENQTLHSTRHTFITTARRSRCAPDHLERVTHNACGTMIDRYTHLDWDPLCEAVACLSYAPTATPARAPVRTGTWAPPGSPKGAPPGSQKAVVVAAKWASKWASTPQVPGIIVEAPGIEP